MNEKIVVHKLNDKGRQVWSYSGLLTEKSETSITITATYEGKDEDFHGLRLREGDLFIETFHSDRWYNVFAVHDVDDGRLKGWYCNITRPACIETGHVFAEDLALDLVVLPSGTWRVLDEEQFAELNISLEERQQALKAMTELQTLVARRRGPFEDVEEFLTDQ